MPEREFNIGGYRFGYNSQEHDRELNPNLTTAKFWEYEGRLARRWNADPKFNASESRYSVNGDNPISYIDPNGDFKTKFGAWLYKIGHGGGEIGRHGKTGQYYVGKQVKYTGDEAGVAYQRRFDWNGGKNAYTGSGWGHTARSLAANALGVDGNAKSLIDLGMNSVLQNGSVQLQGDLLEKVKLDPAIQSFENSIVSAATSDKERFGKVGYSFNLSKNVQLGGERGSLNPLDASSIKTLQVGLNPLTWAVRSVQVQAEVQVSAEGCMSITYSFTDNFDLRPEKGGKVYFGGSGNSPFSSGGGQRPWQYNTVSSVMGVPYHDIVGGNDQMKINATWTSKR